MERVEYIKSDTCFFAIILRSDFSLKNTGIQFFTPDDFSQQLGIMKRSKGYLIKPHIHQKNKRNIQITNEVLFLKKGKVRVDFYEKNKTYFKSSILNTGDTILLAGGGHGFFMMESSELIEVKQGPYDSEKDKIQFDSISHELINI